LIFPNAAGIAAETNRNTWQPTTAEVGGKRRSITIKNMTGIDVPGRDSAGAGAAGFPTKIPIE
jgi:hypothetical protein